nr:MAG TPA: hypothetical protein [Caudoviricetes sp.]
MPLFLFSILSNVCKIGKDFIPPILAQNDITYYHLKTLIINH